MALATGGGAATSGQSSEAPVTKEQEYLLLSPKSREDGGGWELCCSAPLKLDYLKSKAEEVLKSRILKRFKTENLPNFKSEAAEVDGRLLILDAQWGYDSTFVGKTKITHQARFLIMRVRRDDAPREN